MSRRSLPWLLLLFVLFALYALSAPAVINGDGVGYVRAARADSAPVPGHLLYLPLLKLLMYLCPRHLVEAARLVNALAGALGVLCVYLAMGMLISDKRSALFGSLGLALSHGYWVQAADVETYALAALGVYSTFLALCAFRARPALARLAWIVLLATASAFVHVTNLLFLACVAVGVGWPSKGVAIALRRRLAMATVACVVPLLVVVMAHAWVAMVKNGQSPPEAWAWFRGAGHGFVYLFRPYNLTSAIHGFAKALVFAPNVHEADISVTLGQFLFGLVPLGIGCGLVAFRARSLPRLPLAMLIAWAAPYIVIGILFFGDDSERWIFVLPVFWLLVAAALQASRPTRMGMHLVAYLAIVNLVTAVIPGKAEITARWKARAVDGLVSSGDLVVFPGHDWDEYIGFYDERDISVFPLAFHVGSRGKDNALSYLEDQVRWTRGRDGQVFVVRVLDDDPGPRGWDELHLLGFPRKEAAAYFRDHHDPVRLEPVRG
ncbi:MAG: DUF2723 domain-containing protein, partial [Deltaproteobacteria bacterium]|nr:DUF2723 domain-containing protein [Deltaproteobacteria bacterium]